MNLYQLLRSFSVIFLVLISCSREENFSKIGDNLSGPSGIALSKSGKYFYVLNSDFDRTFNSGSILVIDEKGTKVNSLPTRRLGRSLSANDDFLIAIYESFDKKSKPLVELYNIKDDEANPTLVKQWDLNCSPSNAVLINNYTHFTVSCSNGGLYLGTLDANNNYADSKLKLVRKYALEHRALYLDKERELIVAFPTIYRKPGVPDLLAVDLKSFDKNGIEIKINNKSVANDVPDEFEESRIARSRKNIREYYKYIVYDIKKERENPESCAGTEECESFPYRASGDVFTNEHRWLYYNATQKDGTLDIPKKKEGEKYYRTNFWDAKADLKDNNVFYISHRGIADTSPHANDVLSVTITGDLRTKEDGTVPKTPDVLTFKRVNGYKEDAKYKYPTELHLQSVNGSSLLFLNNFRGVVSWKREDVYYSIIAQGLDTEWTHEHGANKKPQKGWYGIKVNERGIGMSSYFYDNKLILLEVFPGSDIKEVKTIN